MPQPDGPITATASPARISNDTPARAVVSPYSLRTSVSRTTTSDVLSALVMATNLGRTGRGRHQPGEVTSGQVILGMYGIAARG
ncbi:hypothetical protein GCM10022225_32990 [Plantactinospora mayteni]|uniref:Uncharacterized protein n=1 Tax=Plantactinospora mayteni TaxID=566021 RepID=A0ABQ4EM90_9ACTN|nr:hypothetical protein Pma05_21100 [Plantactinospora mayteni]